ncbi:hypothetical protein BRCON_0035 [Candidatus Sumerlaea chitinivorans]|uniref:Glycosyltransferase RgtA/B/C/D-like domain-containing protein n=1 Tax=Sumerlaea chitinivorans TaxID=2250252 RepID=A0A2Z4Y239_SUMC1|nr:hypothetical protein BRCON_0035 [Candidatus Sumerlaea chitinivorans]
MSPRKRKPQRADSETPPDEKNPQSRTEPRPTPPPDSQPVARLRIVGLNAAERPTPEEPPSPPPPPSRRAEDEKWDPYFSRRVRLLDFLAALILGVVAFFAVVTTYRGFGHSWDEALYLRPAAAAGTWVWDLLRGDRSLLEESAITHAWGVVATGDDPLHPEVAPIPKAVIGLAMTALSGYGIPEMQAMRLPIAGAFALTVALIYLIGARAFGRMGGLVAALCYGLMPRVFGHAHIAASETLFALTLILFTWAYLAGVKRPFMAVWCALAFALAVNTKVTALLLPLPAFLWGQIYHRRDYATNAFFMLFIAPIFAWLLWPWLWYDPLGNFSEYLRFYATHQSTAVFYMGQKWGYIYGPPAPWHYPLVITAIGTPPWILALAILGIASAWAHCKSRSVPMFFFLMAGAFIAVCSMPKAPKYDGERLFFGAFAFLALLAGGGYEWFVEGIARRTWVPAMLRRWIRPLAALLFFICVGVGVATIRWVHPNELNYFNLLVGGPKGAYERGFETSYWGEAVNEEVIEYLNSLTKPGTKFKPLALNELAFQNLQGWGLLSSEGVYAAATEPFDYYILQVRQGFFGNLERALHYGAEPLRTFSAQGVPRIQVFAGDALTKPPRRPEKTPSPAPSQSRTDTTTHTLGNGTSSTATQTLAISPAVKGDEPTTAATADDKRTTPPVARDPALREIPSTVPETRRTDRSFPTDTATSEPVL